MGLRVHSGFWLLSLLVVAYERQSHTRFFKGDTRALSRLITLVSRIVPADSL